MNIDAFRISGLLAFNFEIKIDWNDDYNQFEDDVELNVSNDTIS